MNAVLVALAILLLFGVGLVLWQLHRLRATLIETVNKSPHLNSALADSVKEQRTALESFPRADRTISLP
jgi:hypothetical protein